MVLHFASQITDDNCQQKPSSCCSLRWVTVPQPPEHFLRQGLGNLTRSDQWMRWSNFLIPMVSPVGLQGVGVLKLQHLGMPISQDGRWWENIMATKLGATVPKWSVSESYFNWHFMVECFGRGKPKGLRARPFLDAPCDTPRVAIWQ